MLGIFMTEKFPACLCSDLSCLIKTELKFANSKNSNVFQCSYKSELPVLLLDSVKNLSLALQSEVLMAVVTRVLNLFFFPNPLVLL